VTLTFRGINFEAKEEEKNRWRVKLSKKVEEGVGGTLFVLGQLFSLLWDGDQGCQMAYLRTKNTNFGICIWQALEIEMLVNFMAI
jgi:hypothetical protein